MKQLLIAALLVPALAAAAPNDDAVTSSGAERAAATQPPAYLATRDKVAVTGGVLSAAADSTASLRVFKGIPFAAPPVGALRWKAPQPVVAWRGVRRTDSFRDGCVAGVRPAGTIGAILYQDSAAQSEDCLHLNVWTGAPASSSTDKRPVMMLIHGGGYMVGAGSQPNYNGTGLASKGAVVVTLNYRLGPLGFLAHPELSAESATSSSGNYALLDAIAALRWIKDNIGAFGGDPGNVTIYSESAGAGLSSVLLGSPLAAGLFHKLVIESLGSMPAGQANPTLKQAEAAGLAFAANLKADNLAALRGRSAAEIMAGAGSIGAPIVDGVVLPDQLDLILARKQSNDVPLIVGWNADEGTPYPPFATTLAGWTTAAAARYGSNAALAAQFAATYPVGSDADAQALAFAPMRDSLFAWQPWTIARAHAAQGRSKTFLYFFDRRPAYFDDQHFIELDPPSKYGAYHSIEQVYFYNNLDRSAPPRAYDPIDRRIAETASSYLVNFAATGDPNGRGLPTWPAFSGSGSLTMAIGNTIGPTAVPFRPALDFFDAFYTQSLGRPLPF